MTDETQKPKEATPVPTDAKDEFAEKVAKEQEEQKKAEEQIRARLQVFTIAYDPITDQVVDVQNIQNCPHVTDIRKIIARVEQLWETQRQMSVLKAVLEASKVKPVSGKIVTK